MVDTDQATWDNFNLFASTTENVKEETIQFQGKIPGWLKGTLYRNASGQNEINNDPSTSVRHAFDGFAFIQKYTVDGSSQSVRFRSSFVKSHTYKESLKNGRWITRQFSIDPCKSLFGRFQTIFYGLDRTMYPDDTGVHVQKVHNELLALTETPIAYVLNPDTLETVAPITSLPYGTSIDSELMTMTTAHVIHDDKRKMTVGYAVRITKKQHWLDVIFISDDKLEAVENNEDDDMWMVVDGRYGLITSGMSEHGKDINRSIKSNTKMFRYPCDEVSYMHSASISDDYLILTEIAFHFNQFNALWTMAAGTALTDMFKWYGATMPTYFRVISLDSGAQVAHIPGPPFFHFHHINSYQTTINNKNIILVDICTFDDNRVINELYLDKLRKNITPTSGGYVRRFYLDLSMNTCTEPFAQQREPYGVYPISHANSLVPVQFELPRISPRYVGKPYRYVYAARVLPNRLFDALIKIDVESKKESAIWIEPCTSPGEPIFVPKSDTDEGENREDDGVVLAIVLEQKAKRSFLLVLDGMPFKELGRAYLPVHIPLSFHGNFY